MASITIDPKLLKSIKTTQKLLGEYVSKPPLLEKYLAKPPFRFIHDIVCNVISNTNFMKDIFTQHELKYENIASPEDKRAFLKKAIGAVESSSGEECPVRTSKILAGKEPEKTNEFLHLMVKGIRNFVKQEKEQKQSEAKKKVEEKVKTEKKSGKIKEEENVKKSGSGKSKRTPSKAVDKQKQSKVSNEKKQEERKVTAVKSKPSFLSMPTTPPKKNVSSEKLKPKSEVSKKPGSSSSSSSLAKRKSTGNLEIKLKASVKSTSVPKLDEATKTGSKGKSPPIPSSPIPADGECSRTSSNQSLLPPATAEEVPAQRPVTRTKFRQEKEGEVNSGGNESDKSKTPVDEEINNQELSPRESTSSEDVITEQMYEKISEWRTDSAEEHPPDQLNCGKGWTQSEPEEEDHLNEIDENCNVKVEKTVDHPGAEKDDDNTEELIERASFTRIKQAEVMRRPVTVIMDNEKDDDEDEAYLIQERRESLDEIVKQSVGLVNAVSEAGLLSQENKSMLVNQILETQRELELLNQGQNGFSERQMIERDHEMLREMHLKQVEQLKVAIQQITKCANPLANIIQRSQDDACLMEIEFRKFRQENERLQKRIDAEKAETTRMLYPYSEELTNLDKCIEKMEGAIALAQQRLHVMDEEYVTDFIDKVAETPTQEEVLDGELDQNDPMKNQLWGGIPVKDVNRVDEEFERKMQNTSLKSLFQMAIDMHTGTAEDFSSNKPKVTRVLTRSRPPMKGNQQPLHHPQFSPSMPVPIQAPAPNRGETMSMGGPKRNVNSYSFGYGIDNYGGGQDAPVIQGVQPQQQQQYQQPSFGFGIGNGRRDVQREPMLQTEIRPSWWD